MARSDKSPDIDAIVEGLSKLEPGYLRFDLFMQMARLSTMACIELVPIRHTTDRVPEVLLVQRDFPGDPWAGEWHALGTILRPTDSKSDRSSYEEPLARLIGDNCEIDSASLLGAPVEIGTEFRMSRRGAELAVVHYVPVSGESTNRGEFFSMEDFPYNVPEKGVVEHHVPMIERAVKAYLKDRKK